MTRAPPTDLAVEYERDPGNVDPTERPRFSWRRPTDRRGATQRAYRVVVGRDRDAVAAGGGTVWDSGRVDSSASVGVDYGGPPLSADETYHWTIRLWTDAGATEWATPGSFTTALRPEDWTGEWITHQPDGGDSNGWRSRFRDPDSAGSAWVQVDLGEPRPLSAVRLHPAAPVDVVRTPDGAAVATAWSDTPREGFGFPDSYRVEVADDPEFADAAVVADVTDGLPDRDDRQDGTAPDDRTEPRSHEGLDASGRYVRVTATDLFEARPAGDVAGDDRRTEDVRPWACFALAALTVEGESGDDLTRGRPVTASSTAETETWGRGRLVDGHVDSRTAASAPLLRTDLSLDRPVDSARMHVAAVGYGELHVNGERVGDRRLDPAWTDYEQRALYASYDLSDRLSAGENALSLWLGRGWFSKGHGYWAGDGSPRARATLTVTFADGTTRTVSTGPDWGAAASPITANDIYDGERYDARREDGWTDPGFDSDRADAATDDAPGWDPATVVDAPGGTLRPERIQPMGVVDRFAPEEVHDHSEGPILDFGQTLTGWVELTIRGADPGDEVVIRHAEALTEDGDLSTTDLRSADAADTYVARGDKNSPEIYEPRFTYHGFRYAQVSGYPGDLDPDDVTAKAVHTAMDRRGDFSCSNADLRQVQHNAVWGLRGNTHSIPEDCPQRDERHGWTGDAQIAARSLLFNYDAARFHEKWLRDHADAASPMGYVGDVIPNKTHENPGDPTWTVTQVMVPWHCYRHDGDERILREHYAGMCDYVDYWHSVTEEGILPETYAKYGDWLAFENTDGRRGLPYELFTTAFHYRATDTLAKIAAVLGNDGDAERYRDRAEVVADAFDDRFFDADAAVYGPGTQSSYAVPLYLGLVPDDREDDVVANLVEKVRGDGDKLRTGFLGTRPLLHTLADHGRADLAYEIVSQPERPGWVYMARNGATTMWERWDSDDSVGSGMNSLNHSPFTHVSEFFYEALAGIRIGDVPVTDHVTLAPALVDDLDWAEASVETPNGPVGSAWERTGSGYELRTTVPWNGSATVRLPGGADASVAESGNPLGDGAAPEGVREVESRDGDLVVDVGAGEYAFDVE